MPDVTIQFVLSSVPRDRTTQHNFLSYIRLSTKRKSSVLPMPAATEEIGSVGCFHDKDDIVSQRIKERFGIATSDCTRRGDGTLLFDPVSPFPTERPASPLSSATEANNQHDRLQGGNISTWQTVLDMPEYVQSRNDDHSSSSIQWKTSSFVVAHRDLSDFYISEIRALVAPRLFSLMCKTLILLWSSCCTKCSPYIHVWLRH